MSTKVAIVKKKVTNTSAMLMREFFSTNIVVRFFLQINENTETIKKHLEIATILNTQFGGGDGDKIGVEFLKFTCIIYSLQIDL